VCLFAIISHTRDIKSKYFNKQKTKKQNKAMDEFQSLANALITENISNAVFVNAYEHLNTDCNDIFDSPLIHATFRRASQPRVDSSRAVGNRNNNNSNDDDDADDDDKNLIENSNNTSNTAVFDSIEEEVGSSAAKDVVVRCLLKHRLVSS
jgi:hypothetical protein